MPSCQVQLPRRRSRRRRLPRGRIPWRSRPPATTGCRRRYRRAWPGSTPGWCRVRRRAGRSRRSWVVVSARAAVSLTQPEEGRDQCIDLTRDRIAAVRKHGSGQRLDLGLAAHAQVAVHEALHFEAGLHVGDIAAQALDGGFGGVLTGNEIERGVERFGGNRGFHRAGTFRLKPPVRGGREMGEGPRRSGRQEIRCTRAPCCIGWVTRLTSNSSRSSSSRPSAPVRLARAR